MLPFFGNRWRVRMPRGTKDADFVVILQLYGWSGLHIAMDCNQWRCGEGSG